MDLSNTTDMGTGMNASLVTSTEANSSGTTSTPEYVLTSDIILWEFNERQFYINMPTFYFLIFIIVLGVIGNGTVIYVFFFKLKRNNANIFASWLSVYDITTMLLLTFECYDKRYPMYSGNVAILCKIERYFITTSSCAAAYLLLCIAFDRFFKICMPLKRMSPKRTKHAVVASFLVPLLTVWPMAVFHGPEARKTPYDGIVGLDCADDDRFSDAYIRTVYYFLFMFIVFASIVILIILYIMMFWALRKWKKFASEDNAKDGGENKLRVNVSQSDKSPGKRKVSKTGSIVSVSSTDDKKTRNNSEKYVHKELDSINSYSETFEGSEMTTEVTNLDDSNVFTASETAKTSKADKLNHRKMRRKRLERKFQGKSNYTSDRSVIMTTTLMFCLVSILYIVSFLPSIVIEAMNAFGLIYNEKEQSVMSRQLTVFTNLSHFLNGAFNPIIYLVFNRSFRLEIIKMFI